MSIETDVFEYKFYGYVEADDVGIARAKSFDEAARRVLEQNKHLILGEGKIAYIALRQGETERVFSIRCSDEGEVLPPEEVNS